MSKSELEGAGGRGTARPMGKTGADNEAGDMAELEAALTQDDDGEEDEGDGLDGLAELTGEKPAAKPRPGQKGEPKGGQKQGEGEEPLTLDGLRARDRQSRAALKEMRTRQKEIEARDAKREQNFQRLVGMIQGGGVPIGRQGAGGADAGPVDVKKDPLRALQMLVEKVGGYEQSLRDQDQQTRAQQQQHQAVHGLIGEFKSDEKEFTLDQPDYPEASAFYIDKRVKLEMRRGFSLEQAQQAVMRELLQTGQVARTLGRNAGELIYEAAQEIGYVRGAGQGGERAEKDPLAPIRAGLKSGRSAGGGGGGSGGGSGETLASILDLEGEDFDKAGDKLLRQLKRGR